MAVANLESQTKIIFTSAEAAEVLGLDISLVCRYCRTGKIKATKAGRDWIITPTALREFQKIPRHPGNPSFRKS